MKNIAIFVSGTGTNAKKIIEYFASHDQARVTLLIANKTTAPALEMARAHQVQTMVIDRSFFYGSEAMLDRLREEEIDLIVLAGFLWLIPPYLVQAFAGRMINIHPALLPKYGGKGMYGKYVHEAVKAAGDSETGITIHLVNEHYDQGDILFQAKCTLTAADTPTDIARKVQKLEHRYFAPVIEKYLNQEPIPAQTNW